MKMGAGVLTGLCIACFAFTAKAEDRALTEQLAYCARIADETPRLACFDRMAAQRVSLQSDPAPAVGPVDDFGVAGGEIARKRAAGRADQPEEAKRLAAAVTAITRRPRGELVMTLDNGQVWAQKTAQPYVSIKVGDAVTIAAGALGSYRLMVGGRSTQVTRVE